MTAWESLTGALPLLSAVACSIALLFVDSGRGRHLDILMSAVPFVLLAIYRIFFHPLSRFPGPISHRITTIPILTKSVIGVRHTYLRELHNKYGSVVRIGPDELSFISPQAVQKIYTSAQAFNKPHIYDMHFAIPEVEGLFFTSDRDKHRVRRKVWQPTLAANAVNDYRPAVLTEVDRLKARLLKDMDKDGVVNAEKICGQWAWDTTNSLWFNGRAFAGDGPFLEKDEVKIMNLGALVLILFDILAYIPLFFYLVKPLPIAQSFRQFERWSDATAQRVLKEGADSHEGIYHMLNNNANPIPHKDLAIEIESILIGGSDTIHAMSTFVMYFLAKEPQWTQKVREELDNVYRHEEFATSTQILDDLPILNAFLSECLRMGQSFSSLPRVAPKEGSVIDNQFIPGGTTVGVPINAYHMDEGIFGIDARSFNPERWLLPDSPVKKYPSLVFGAGFAKCIGIKVAYLELRIMLAKVALELDVDLNPKGFDDDAFWKGVRNWRSHAFKYPLMMSVRPRRDA